MRSTVICIAALLAILVMPAAAAVEVNNTTDISISVFIPCAAGGAGETVDLSGPLHTLVSVTINNNNVSGYTHFQPQGITGTGETTGLKYQATGVTRESFSQSLQNGVATLTYVNNFRIIGQGPGNNYLIHETMHVTINADGTVTVSFDNFSASCR
jgi:opacity protein-like surface antigen